MKLFSILCLLSFNLLASAFTVRSNVPIRLVASKTSNPIQISNCVSVSRTRVYSSGFEDDEEDDFPAASTATPTPTPTPVAVKAPEANYPLDVPSPVLLASSMVLAIATTGSIFELSGGSPVLGFIPSIGIIATGLPLCFFLFYAAIKKGIAETEEDDKKFQSKSNRF